MSLYYLVAYFFNIKKGTPPPEVIRYRKYWLEWSTRSLDLLMKLFLLNVQKVSRQLLYLIPYIMYMRNVQINTTCFCDINTWFSLYGLIRGIFIFVAYKHNGKQLSWSIFYSELKFICLVKSPFIWIGNLGFNFSFSNGSSF